MWRSYWTLLQPTSWGCALTNTSPPTLPAFAEAAAWPRWWTRPGCARDQMPVQCRSMLYQMPGCGPPVAVDLQKLWSSSCCGSRMAAGLEWPWTSTGCGSRLAVDLNWLWTSSAQVSVDLPQMIAGVMWQWSPSAYRSQLYANTMNLGGYTGYGPHCTVGAVTRYPPFCNCEYVYFGCGFKAKLSMRPPWYQHCFHHACQQGCMNCLMHAYKKLQTSVKNSAGVAIVLFAASSHASRHL